MSNVKEEVLNLVKKSMDDSRYSHSDTLFGKGYRKAVEDISSMVKEDTLYESPNWNSILAKKVKGLKKSYSKSISISKINTLKCVVVDGVEMVSKEDLLGLVDNTTPRAYLQGYNRAIGFILLDLHIKYGY